MNLDDFKWNEQGLLPAVVQDHESGKVLMLAWMNREALQKTIDDKKATFWSRSRNALWQKGETSGHTQLVKDIRIDCDKDTILLKVEQLGGIACHTGRESCFYFSHNEEGWQAVDPVIKDPDDIYS